MNNDTQKEIGEFIEEITSKGFGGLMIDIDDSVDGKRRVAVNADCNDRITQIGAVGETLVEALGDVVDQIRTIWREPTRAEELAKMIEANEAHALTVVHCGPDARCGCGAPFAMIFEKTYKFKLVRAWDTGEVCFAEPPPELTIDPGDIGTCLKCGRNYTFGPA